MSTLIPRQTVPELEVATIDGDVWRLGDHKPDNFTMLVFYRGLHCPICRAYLSELNRRIGEFAELGVEVLVLSSDEEDRARQTKEDWKLDKLMVGYGLEIDKAREWGLFISTGVGKTSTGFEEPALFNEPGLFFVRPDGTLYASSILTMPFARPDFGVVLKALDTIIKRDYPARGEA